MNILTHSLRYTLIVFLVVQTLTNSTLCLASTMTPVMVNDAVMRESLVPTIVGLNTFLGTEFIPNFSEATGSVNEDSWSMTWGQSTTDPSLFLTTSGSFDSITNEVTFSGSGTFGALPITTFGSGMFLPNDNSIEFTHFDAKIGEDSFLIFLGAAATVVGIAVGTITIIDFFTDDTEDSQPPKQIEIIQTNVQEASKNITLPDGTIIDIERDGTVPGDVTIRVIETPLPAALPLFLFGLLGLFRMRKKSQLSTIPA